MHFNCSDVLIVFVLALNTQSLQPDIAEFHADVIPRLAQCCDDPSADVREYACYAIEAFVENLGQSLVRVCLVHFVE